jgi:hypothetical protein
VSAPWHCAAHSRTANAPHPRKGAGRTLEPFPRESAGSNHDVRPVGTPSPPLWHHAGHCYNNSGAVERAGTGRRHACHCTPYGSPSTASSSPPEDATANHYAFTLETAPVQVRDAPRRQDWSKGRQDGRQLPGAAECKTNRLAVLTVKSALDPHMIIELEDGLKSCSPVMLVIFLWCILPYA